MTMIKYNRPPDEINKYGTKYWYDNNHKLHNDNGDPALITSKGSNFWYKHGNFHNDFGPAIIWVNGTKIWYKHGKQLTENEFKQFKIKEFIDGK